jgi:hypothetical protein
MSDEFVTLFVAFHLRGASIHARLEPCNASSLVKQGQELRVRAPSCHSMRHCAHPVCVADAVVGGLLLLSRRGGRVHRAPANGAHTPWLSPSAAQPGDESVRAVVAHVPGEDGVIAVQLTCKNSTL